MLENRQVHRALSIHVHDVGLVGEAVRNAGHVAEQNRRTPDHLDRNRVELLHRRWTGVHQNGVLAVADPGGARGDDHIGRLQRVDHVRRGEPFRRQRPRIDVHVDLALLASERRWARKTGNGEQSHPDEIEPVVEDLLFGEGFAGSGQLSDRDVGGVELDDVGWLHPGGRDPQQGARGGGHLGNCRADVGPGLEVDLDNSDAGNRLGFDPFNAVDRGGVGALADQNHPALHVLRGQAGVIPDHDHHRDVDRRKNIHHHPAERKDAHHQDQQTHDCHGVGAPQRQLDYPHRGSLRCLLGCTPRNSNALLPSPRISAGSP